MSKTTKFKLLCIGAMLLSLPAFAERSPVAADDAIRADYNRILDGLRQSYRPYSDTVAVNKGGRTDRVLMTNASWETTVSRLKSAHQSLKPLPSGERVIGWFLNKTKRSANFTLQVHGHSYTVTVKALPSGTKFVLWGDVRSHAALRANSKNGRMTRHGHASPGLRRL